MNGLPSIARSAIRAAVAGTLASLAAGCQVQRQGSEVPTNYDPQSTEVAFAGEVADTGTLDNARGGFLVVNGMQIDLTFEITTALGSIDAITSVLTLDDILSGRAGLITTSQGTFRGATEGVVISGIDGVTEITHMANPMDGVQAVVRNTASGAEVMTVVNTTIDIVMPRNPRVGLDLPMGRSPVGPELRQSVLSSLPR